MAWKKKTAIILIALTVLIVITALYSIIWRIQYSNQMISEGCRVDQYDILGLPSRWQCPVNLQVINV